MTADDAEAVRRSLAGDQDAYEVLVVRYTAAAHRAAYFFGAGDEAEDVVQESFVKAYQALHRFRLDSPFRPWLLRIVANETRNAVRGRRRRDGLARRALDYRAPIDPVLNAITEDRGRTLLSAVRGLSDKDRSIVVCRFFLELSEAETAQTLSLPLGTVKSRTSRALERLREQLGRPLGEELSGA